MYEKQRFHDLHHRESLNKDILNSQKQIQMINSEISKQTPILDNLRNTLEVKMNKKTCLELLLAELIIQIRRFGLRIQEAERIDYEVAHANSIAAKKAKLNRLTSFKPGGNTLGSTAQMNK